MISNLTVTEGNVDKRRIQRVILVTGAGNLIVVVAKLIVGFAVGSAVILADAIHSMTDLANNGLAFFTVRIAAAPPDREHPYGHRKFETIAVFALAILLTVVAIEIALRAFSSLGQPVVTTRWGLVVMVLVLAMNLAISTWESYWARRLRSALLNADARHTLSDALTTVAVIAGWQLAAYGLPWLDAIFALLVAGLVSYLAADLFRLAIPTLVDQAATDPERLIQAIRGVPGVRTIRRVRSRTSGERAYADVIVTVDGRLSTEASHQIADCIEDVLAKQLGIQDVAVHIEPELKS